jgi:murein DD-endopeptidase MepM/ murein hydrolase activator NlpD
MRVIVAILCSVSSTVCADGIRHGTTPPEIYSTYKSRFFFQYPRAGEHAGVDYGATRGAPVIAAAPGKVKWVVPFGDCGTLVSIQHIESDKFEENKFTVYCHMEKVLVKMGQEVKRGEQIGTNGSEGNAPWDAPHVHFEVNSDGVSHASGFIVTTSVDPQSLMVGCFDPTKIYPDPREKLVLTYPLLCR